MKELTDIVVVVVEISVTPWFPVLKVSALRCAFDAMVVCDLFFVASDRVHNVDKFLNLSFTMKPT